jgi:hypothetical protein
MGDLLHCAKKDVVKGLVLVVSDSWYHLAGFFVVPHLVPVVSRITDFRSPLHMKQILHRILSFDGGGIRGLYHAKLLERLNARKLDVAKRADIVAGTSTGAIVAAALAVEKAPERITELYTEVGKKVFPPCGPLERAFKAAKAAVSVAPGYSSAVLRNALEAELGKETTLGECTKRLIVPAISINKYKLKVFDSNDESDKKQRLVDVVLASAAAPTYFLPVEGRRHLLRRWWAVLQQSGVSRGGRTVSRRGGTAQNLRPLGEYRSGAGHQSRRRLPAPAQIRLDPAGHRPRDVRIE